MEWKPPCDGLVVNQLLYKVSKELCYYKRVLLRVPCILGAILKFIMYSKSTANMRSDGSHFLTAGLFMCWTYKVKKKLFNGELQGSAVEGYYEF